MSPPCVVKIDRFITVSLHNPYPHVIQLKKGCSLGTISPVIVHKGEEEVVEMMSDLDHSGSPDEHPLSSLHSLDFLPDSKRVRLEQLLKKYHMIFSRHELDIGKYRFGKVKLTLKPGCEEPVRDAPRKFNVQQSAALKEHVDHLQKLFVCRMNAMRI